MPFCLFGVRIRDRLSKRFAQRVEIQFAVRIPMKFKSEVGAFRRAAIRLVDGTCAKAAMDRVENVWVANISPFFRAQGDGQVDCLTDQLNYSANIDAPILLR